MGYKRMNTEDLYSIFRRWHAGQAIKHIALVEGRDRKTVRSYSVMFLEGGYSVGKEGLQKEEILSFVRGLFPTKTDKPAENRECLEVHPDEIKKLITDSKEHYKEEDLYKELSSGEILNVKHKSELIIKQGLSHNQKYTNFYSKSSMSLTEAAVSMALFIARSLCISSTLATLG